MNISNETLNFSYRKNKNHYCIRKLIIIDQLCKGEKNRSNGNETSKLKKKKKVGKDTRNEW